MPETPTTRLGLYKPLNNGSENVNVQQDLNQNWDKVDLAAGFQIVTSGTRPATPYSGKGIAESDTAYRTHFSNGTAPASASWVEIPNSSGTFGSNLKLASTAQLVWAADTNLYRSAANVLATDDDFAIVTAGKTLRIKEGTNAKMGRSTLVGGTVVVATTAVAATSEIFLTCQTPGGTPGFLRVSARTAGTSFTILSSSGTDTSVVAWMIIDPA